MDFTLLRYYGWKHGSWKLKTTYKPDQKGKWMFKDLTGNHIKHKAHTT